MPMRGKDFPQAPRCAGFVSHEQLYCVQMEKFRHIETERGIITEKIAGKFERQFGLTYAGRPEKKKGTKRLAGRLQPKLAPFQHRTHAGNDMALSLDLGKQMGFEAGEIFDGGIHDWGTG